MYSDPDLVPFEPPPQPLGLRGLPVIWRNYIESIPRGCYEGGGVRIKRRGSDVILISAPDLIGEVLVDQAEKFERDHVTRRAFAPTIGRNSLFLAEGAEWRWQRRAVAPIFRHDTLMSFVPVFAAMAERQIAQWRGAANGAGSGEPIDAAAAMTRTTFDIIVETMLGGSANLDADRYSAAIKESFETIPWHIIYAQFSLPEWLPYPRRGRARRARAFMYQEIRRTIETRRGRNATPPDLLDLLLSARDPESGRTMTDDEVMRNLITFITAGHETTSVALAWTLWLLAKDQASQRRVVDEVAAVLGDRPVDAAGIDQLVFCRQVIQEAMRLFPPAPVISRVAKTAATLGDIAIGPGARVHIPIYALHRNATLWQDPNAFDPDRFAAERAKAYSRYAYLPFGGGPRVCIGASFAMLEATAILACLVRAFRFDAVPGHKPKPVARVTLRPQGGMPLLIVPR